MCTQLGKCGPRWHHNQHRWQSNQRSPVNAVMWTALMYNGGSVEVQLVHDKCTGLKSPIQLCKFTSTTSVYCIGSQSLYVYQLTLLVPESLLSNLPSMDST